MLYFLGLQMTNCTCINVMQKSIDYSACVSCRMIPLYVLE